MTGLRTAILITAALAVLALGSAAWASGGRVSHATNFQTPSHMVVCGIASVYGSVDGPGTGAPLRGQFMGLQCSAPGISRAPGSEVGDPFVQLGQGTAGRARVVDLSQDDLLYNRAPRTLASGTTWSRNNLTCHIRTRSITCWNAGGHGFTLRPGHLRRH